MEVGTAWDDRGLCSEVGATELDTLLQERERKLNEGASVVEVVRGPLANCSPGP